jgi:hypothetical protein
MNGFEIREYLPGDEVGILPAFNAVFGADNPNHVERGLDEWRWCFERNPAGRRIVVALHEGRVVGQYAAVPYRTRLFGEERAFLHIVDSMMLHEYRSARYKRPGLFVHTAYRFFELYGGKYKDPIHYGMPVEKHFKLGARYLGYEIVRTHGLLAREPGAGPTALPDGVERLERFPDDVAALYERCAADWQVSAVRDAAMLNWRFADHPTFDYRILAVRDGTGALLGTAVVRVANWILPHMAVLCDWLVPPDEPAVGERLRGAVEALGRAAGASALITLFPHWSPWFARFQEAGWLVHASNYFMGARTFDRRIEQAWLRENWWYQLTDVDLV